jgi:hypothetical protein
MRLSENAHLLRYPHPSSLKRHSMYASFLGISEALHLDIFHQPLRNGFFDNLNDSVHIEIYAGLKMKVLLQQNISGIVPKPQFSFHPGGIGYRTSSPGTSRYATSTTGSIWIGGFCHTWPLICIFHSYPFDSSFIQTHPLFLADMFTLHVLPLNQSFKSFQPVLCFSSEAQQRPLSVPPGNR